MKSQVLKTLEPIFFPVRKVPASNSDPKMRYNSWLSHDIIVELPDGPLKVNVCSGDYGLVSNKELLKPIIKELEANFGEIEVSFRMHEYSKFYIDFKLKDNQLRGANKKDLLFPRLRINNSYDGSVKFSFLLALWRLICSNGMMAPVEGSMKEGKFMHTPQVDAENSVNLVMEKLTIFIEKSKEIVRLYDPLIDHKLSMADALERMEEIRVEVDYPKKLVEHAAARLNIEAIQLKQPINDYLVYNALNYALYNSGETVMPDHKKDKIDVKVMDFLLEENK